MARSRRTPTVLILPMPLVAFQPLKPAPGGPATAFPWTENKCETPEESFVLVLGLVVEKLRATWVDQSPSRSFDSAPLSTVSPDKPRSRSAQDDDFAGVLTKIIPVRLTLMGLASWAKFSRPYGTEFG